MNYENNNVPGTQPGTDGNQYPNVNNQPNYSNFNQMGQPPMNDMNGMNSMNTIAPGMGDLNNIDMSPSKSKKHLIPIIIAVIAIIGIVGGLITVKTIYSSPKVIFQGAIKNAYKGMSNTLEEVDKIMEKFDIKNKALTFDINASIDTNIEEFKELGFDVKDANLSVGMGLDANKKEALSNVVLKGEKEEITIKNYYSDEKIYLDSNLLDNIYYDDGTEVDIDFDEINRMIDKLLENMPETKDVDYVMEAFANALADSLDKDHMEKTQEKIEIKDEKTYTQYSYKLTDKAVQSIAEDTLDKLLDDDKFIEIVADITEQEKDEVKDYLQELRDTTDEIEIEDKIVLNVYTQGLLNDFAGFSIEVENEEVLTYIDDGKNFRVTIASDYVDKDIVIEGSRDGKSIKITYEYDEENNLEIDIKEFSNEKIDVTLSVTIDGDKLSGSFYISCKEETSKVSGDYKLSISYNDEYVSLNGSYKFTAEDKLDIPDLSKAIRYDLLDEEEVANNLEDKMKKDKILDVLCEEMLKQMRQPADLDSYDMIPLYAKSDIQKIKDSGKPAVLYMGDTYYFDDEEADAMFEDLQRAQVRNNFYSYRTSEFNQDYVIEVFPEATPKCVDEAGTICKTAPAIYFINNGTVVSSLIGRATLTEIEGGLMSIGLLEPVTSTT